MKRSLKHIIIAIVVVCCFASASHYFTQPQKTQASALKKNFSGEELYRGIFFFQGEAGKKMNVEVAKQVEKAQSKPETKQFIDGNIAYVKKQDPDYFKKLEQAIYKQDIIKVKKFIEQGRENLEKYFKVKGFEQNDSEDANGEMRSIAVFVPVGLLAVFVNAAAVVQAVVVTHVGIGAVYALKVTVQFSKSLHADRKNNTGSSEFEFEKVVTDVVERFN